MKRKPSLIPGKSILTIVLLLIVSFVQAQRPLFKQVELPDEIRSINALLTENNTAIWLATAQGLYRYTNDEVTRYFEKDRASLYQINAIAKDNDETLWFGTYNGNLVKFTNGKVSQSIDIKPHCKKNNYLITSVSINNIQKENNEILLTTSGGEIFGVIPNRNSVRKIKSPSDATIYSILYGFSPMIWLCTSDGFYTMNKNSKWKKKAGLYTAYGLAENNGKYWAIGRDEQKKAVLMLYFNDSNNGSKKRFTWKDFELSKLNDRYIRFYELGLIEDEIAWIASESGLIRYNPMNGSVKLYEKDKKLNLKEIKQFRRLRKMKRSLKQFPHNLEHASHKHRRPQHINQPPQPGSKYRKY